MKPPAKDPRQRRHSMKTVRLARRMYDGGWTPTQISRYLAANGAPAAVMTVRCWVIPGEAEVQRQRNLTSYHNRKDLRRPDRLVVKLREAGVPRTSIAKVCTVLFGEPWSRDQVCRVLEESA